MESMFTSRPLRPITVAKNFCGEGFEGGAGLPCVWRQAGFSAGLLQKSGTIPSMLDGNLGQEQAAAATHRDQQTVPTDLHLLWPDGSQRRKDAERDLQIGKLIHLQRPEAGVIERGGAGGFR